MDPKALRDAFGAFLTGVTVVTTHDGNGLPVGFTANSFTSVSLDPPLLLVCLARTSRNFDTLTEAAGFAVNILSEGQKDISNTFARPVEDRFAGLDWQPGPHGAPVLANVAAWFDCALDKVVEGGDHVILLGRVKAFANGGANGLGYARGGYFMPGLTQKAVSAAGSDAQIVAGAVVVRGGEILLMEDAKGRYGLPSCIITAGQSPETLRNHLARATCLQASIGFIYSVYEDTGAARHHIVYRCELGAGEPAAGRFFALDALPLDRLADSATADILRRYAAESALGNFGMYVGDERSGRVHPVSGEASR
ncbi:flavin reductase [Manganibacter manganicus]|uniref:Flavin reductase n=1 Tax=Manganibacter manganicus TaxID=1873176 RepID=A0A1V8RM00_9HYPH|nr:flavin reductase [Pseudaminobacter manganicus]OQM74235.1 flavin reductase [Pseudaminobacter manganicus]